ncbi:MAG: GtrA family protein [Arcobacter sp.]|nr:GtrA family protein [Arcobacter sp.]
MKIVKYFFTGGAAAIVDVGLFFIFAKFLSYNYLIVGLFTFVIATFVNYYLSIKFVFISGVKFKKRYEVLMVYLASTTSLVFNLLLLYVFHELLFCDVGLSKILVTGLLFFYNYSIRKYIIFKV